MRLHSAFKNWVLRFGCLCRMETVEHALSCAVRIIRTLLGPSAVEDSKVDFGMSLSVLGCTLESSTDGFRCFPTADKVCLIVTCRNGCRLPVSAFWLQVKKWVTLIQCALKDELLKPGTASKLSGKLSWVCSKLFHRFGRAMLRYARILSGIHEHACFRCLQAVVRAKDAQRWAHQQ